MADKRTNPAPRKGGEAQTKNAGKRPTHSNPPGPLFRYKPPKGRAVTLRLSATEAEMLAALIRCPCSRFDLTKRRPRLGLSGPQVIERLRKAGVEIETEWARGLDRDGRPVRFGIYRLTGIVQEVAP